MTSPLHTDVVGSLLSSPQFNFPPPPPPRRPPSHLLLPRLSVSLGLRRSQAYLLPQSPHCGQNIVCLAILKLSRPTTPRPCLFSIPCYWVLRWVLVTIFIAAEPWQWPSTPSSINVNREYHYLCYYGSCLSTYLRKCNLHHLSSCINSKACLMELSCNRSPQLCWL